MHGSAICVSINSVAFVGYVMNLCFCFELSVISLGRCSKGRGRGEHEMHRRGEGVKGQRGGVLTCPIFETARKKTRSRPRPGIY